MSDDDQLAAFFQDFRSFLSVDSAFDESHKRRLQSNRAQQKLLRLPPTFFLNLATDVHDELTRRISKSAEAVLQHNSTFHPRRNISRQKLARLSANRFNDLCFDILFEIERRNPNLRDDQSPVSIPVSSDMTSSLNRQKGTSSDKSRSTDLSQNEVPPLLAAGNVNSTNSNNNKKIALNSDSENDITIKPTLPTPPAITVVPEVCSGPVDSESSERNTSIAAPASSAPLVIVPTDKTSSTVPDTAMTPIRTQFTSADLSDSQPAPPSSVGSWSGYSDITHTPSTALTSPATSEAGAAVAPLKLLSNTKSSASIAEPSENSNFQASMLTTSKSTLVENSDDDHEADFSDVSDDEEELQPGQNPGVNAALRAWSLKNSSQADITILNHPFNASGEFPSSSDSEEGNEDRYGLAHDFNLLAKDDDNDLDEDRENELNDLTLALSQSSVGNPTNSNDTRRFSYPLHSIEEERTPYIPQNLLKRASTSPYNSQSSNGGAQMSQERRRSLSETMSLIIPGGARSRSFSKLDGMLITSSKSGSPDSLRDSLRSSSGDSIYQRTIKEKDDHIKALIDEGTRLDDTISRLEKQLSESETQRQTLVQENTKLHAALSVAESEKNTLNQELNAKDEQIESVRAESENKVVQAAHDAEQLLTEKLEAKDRELAQALEKKDEEIAQLRANKDSELAQLLVDKESEFAKLKTSRDGLELQHEKLKDKHSEVLSKQTKFAESSASLSSQILLLERLRKKLKDNDNSKAQYSELQRDYNKLETELKQQQKVTDQVRMEASAFLEEMRALAESQSAWGGSEHQAKELASMQNEIKEWKAKYAKCKSQLRSLKTTSICATTATSSSVITIPSATTSRAFVSSAGLIADASVARFQIAIDEFVLQTRKRGGDEKTLLEKLHGVVVATRTITQEVGSANLNDEQLYRSDTGVVKEYEELQGELAQATSLVSATANQLIITSRNHCAAKGFASVLLVDAASADLSSAVIELIKLAKVRGSGSRSEFVATPDSSSPGSRTLLPSRPTSLAHQTHRRDIGSAGSHSSITSIEGLQDFLESRTIVVIEAIASLLNGIKGNANYGVIRRDVAAITDGAHAVIAATHHSPVNASHDVGAVLSGLESSCHRFQTIYGESSVYDEALLPDKALKQRLAGLSSEMARWTTDLLKIVESVRSGSAI
ncbi:hypothetical protein D0Z00_001266 [Geotrichum galactomycetum]|uniref:Uncharacterized protein n=1 Tax=Geotrichum galactomycetum TaxID=27317 RepID=A0ACB6V7I4_9ASCO|nr:hypothetical protein D0Z00_001266 [Geotrichum candidum]